METPNQARHSNPSPRFPLDEFWKFESQFCAPSAPSGRVGALIRWGLTCMRLIFLLLLADCIAGYASASEPYRVDANQEAFAEQTPTIDHLEPVSGVVPEFYYIAQFIESPSFSTGTYFAVLKKQDGKYAIQLAKIPPDSRPTNTPKAQSEVEISKSIADVVYEIWVNGLLETRYDRKSYQGTDGTRYTFSSFVRGTGWMHGSIWSPESDLPPKWLVDAAKEIVAFARDPKRDEKKTEANLRKTRDKLFAYVKTHGKH